MIGDMAHFETDGGAVLPGLAPVAAQQGRYAARSIMRRISGETRIKPFGYFDTDTSR